MDEILVANFMVFPDLVEDEPYDLWIVDEGWDVDHFLHDNPELKRTAYAWLTDFVGWLPMPDGGAAEAGLTADWNAERVERMRRYPRLRDRSIFVGNPGDLVDDPLGPGLPTVREWAMERYAFAGYVIGSTPPPDREALRAELGYRPDERVCLVTVGGSGVGTHLLRRVVEAFPHAEKRVPGLRMVAVTGPRIDPDVDRGARGRRGARVRARPVPAPGGLRRGGRPGRADDHDGAGRGPPAVPLRAARAPLRAAGARAAAARAVRRRPPVSTTRQPGSGAARRARSPPRSTVRSTTGRSSPTAPRGPRRCSPSCSERSAARIGLPADQRRTGEQ